MTKALICGVSGQDGAYLAKLLIGKGYEVWGTSRDAQTASFANLHALGIAQKIRTVSMAPGDFRSTLQAIEDARPDEIYSLAGQTSVGLSFEQPAETIESNLSSTLNMLEAIRFLNRPIRFYHAGSSECFGDTGNIPASETTPFQPRSPYAVAKAASHWLVANYRSAYKLHACTGILFNHESPLRPRRFVTSKIARAAVDIFHGHQSTVLLGDLSVQRDWNWSPEYVEAMWAMMQIAEPADFVIATDDSHSLEEFVACAFAEVGLDWRKHVVQDPSLVRRTEIRFSGGDPSKAHRELGWQARMTMPDVVKQMVRALSAVHPV